MIKDFEDLKDRLREVVGKDCVSIEDASNLSKWKLIEVIKIFGIIRARKYERRHSLLGDMQKALTEEIYNKLLKVEKNPKIKLAIKVQGLLALRISEVEILKITNIDFKGHMVRIYEPKTDKFRDVPMCKEIEKELLKHIKKNRNKINAHNGFIFYSENVTEDRQHISKNWLAHEIEKKIEETGMQKVYVIDRSGKPRHLYTSHSLRGYGIMKFHKNQQRVLGRTDIILTMKFAGHKKIENTMRYTRVDHQEIFNVVQSY